MSESANNDELAAFQAALARLRPTPDSISIARLLFQAGQRSVARRSWTWPCVASTSMMLAVVLGFVLLFRPAVEPGERIVTVLVPVEKFPTPTEKPPIVGEVSNLSESGWSETYSNQGGGDYLRLRSEVLARGLDALPPPTPWSAVAPSNDVDTLLDLPRGSREPWLIHLKRSLQSGGPS